MPVAKGAWTSRCCGLNTMGPVIHWGAWFGEVSVWVAFGWLYYRAPMLP